MPKVQPEYLAQRREQIVHAAAACFSRKGFHRTTMQDICEESNLSPGAVYRYFGSKEEIIDSMSSQGVQLDLTRIEAALAQPTTLERFEGLLQTFLLNPPAEDCPLSIELVAESARNESIREFQLRAARMIRELLEEVIGKGQEAGEIDPSLDREAVARVMTAMYQGLLVQLVIDPDLDTAPYAAVCRALLGGSFWLGAEQGSHQTNPASALRH